MKLVGTRIRVEKSDVKTEYFPEYCLEWKTWYGKTKQQWYGVVKHCHPSYFAEAYDAYGLNRSTTPYTKEWAEGIITLALKYKQRAEQNKQHANTKQTEYYKHP